MEPKHTNPKKTNIYKEYDATKSNNIALLKKYTHDIRNMKSLNGEMLNNISNMSHEDKMIIILSFNSIVGSFKDILDDL
jgi:hypothetical protein